MGRRASVNFCMLCDCSPCECSSASRAPKKKKVLTAKPDIQPAPVIEPPKQGLTVNVSEEDAVFNSAIRALAGAGLLSKHDRDKFRDVIGVTPSPEEKALAWRVRRRQ